MARAPDSKGEENPGGFYGSKSRCRALYPDKAWSLFGEGSRKTMRWLNSCIKEQLFPVPESETRQDASASTRKNAHIFSSFLKS